MKYVAYDAYKGCFYAIQDWAAERVIKSPEPMINGNVSKYKDDKKMIGVPDGKVYLLIEPGELEKMLNKVN